MMLRKSYSTEWQTLPSSHEQSRSSETSAHVGALYQNFEEIKGEMRDFQGTFSEWLSFHRQVLTDDKESYLKTLSQEQGNQYDRIIFLTSGPDLVEALKKQLATLVTKRQNVVAALQGEQKEFEESQKVNKDLEQQRTTLIARLSQLKEEISCVKTTLTEEDAELQKLRVETEVKQTKEKAELELFQEKLGLYVVTPSNGLASFSFKYIDPADWERKFTISLDINGGSYRVHECKPQLPSLGALLDKLHKDFNFYGFLREVRQAFVESVSK